MHVGLCDKDAEVLAWVMILTGFLLYLGEQSKSRRTLSFGPSRCILALAHVYDALAYAPCISTWQG
jgi:hypothetical protein